MDKTFIDKLAYIYIQDQKVLVTLSKGKDVWYIPGGKREQGESDKQALIREVKEELTVVLVPDSITYYGTFEAQAHGKPEGTMVRMTCYMADFSGQLQPAAEIDKMDFFEYSRKIETSHVDFLIFDDLKEKNLIR
jgi:8-oxo-dGTP diphosphatase